jgi:hypothetical protein
MIEPPVNRLPNLTRQNSVRPLLTRHTPTPEGKPFILAFFTSKSSHYLVTGCQLQSKIGGLKILVSGFDSLPSHRLPCNTRVRVYWLAHL